MAALTQRSGGRPHFVFELDAKGFKPVHRIECVVGKVFDKLGRALLVPSFERGLVELLHGVFDALFLLALRVDGIERSFGNVRRTACDATLLDDDDLRSRLRRRYGGREARSASAHHAYVGVVRAFDVVCRASCLFKVLGGPGLLLSLIHI